MGTVNVNLGETAQLNLVAQQLENAVTEVVFDFSDWETAYGSGTLGLSVQRPGDDQPYAVTLTVSGMTATWTVTSLDTAYSGIGEIQVTYTVGSVVKKSVVYKFTVYGSLGANGEYPSPGQSWQDNIEDEINNIQQELSQYEGIFTGDVDESVRNWLDEHPEATTTVEDGSITTPKLSTELNKRVSAVLSASAISVDNAPSLSTSGYYMQGVCWNKDKQRLCFVFHTTGTADPSCLLIETDTDLVEKNRATLNLYHGNDITYNPNDGCYYVADGENSNKIYKVNGSSLALVDTISVDLNTLVSQISYDEDTNNFYITGGDLKVWKASADFSAKENICSIPSTHFYDNMTSFYVQGSCVIGDYFVSQSWLYGSESDSLQSCTRLYFISKYTGEIVYFSDVNISSGLSDEIEGVTYIGSQPFLIGYTSEYITKKLLVINGELSEPKIYVTNGNSGNINKVPLNSAGLFTLAQSSSPTGTDLTGNYICYGTNDNQTFLLNNDNDLFMRVKKNGTWQPWKRFQQAPAIVVKKQTVATNQTLGGGGSSTDFHLDVDAVEGYTPVYISGYSTTPPCFCIYALLEANQSSPSGFKYWARYRNTNASQITDGNFYVDIIYVKD